MEYQNHKRDSEFSNDLVIKKGSNVHNREYDHLTKVNYSL